MSGRGDNNKNGTSGRGASNQSNQPFAGDGQKQPKSNHGKQTGAAASEEDAKKQDPSANRGSAKKKGSGK